MKLRLPTDLKTERTLKQLFAMAAVLALFTGIAVAQSTPAWEVSGGYRYTRYFDPGNANLYGLNVAVQENKNSWFGGVFDFGAAFHHQSGVNEQLVTFMFGPQFTYRKMSNLQPFARVLFGGARDSISSGPNDTSYAAGGGGGIDVHLTRNLYFRGSLDLIHTGLYSSNQNFVQASSGIVYRIGKAGGTR